MMKCYLCGSNEFIRRDGSVRDNSSLEILECKSCSLVQLSSLTHIDEGFYEESNMSEDLTIEQWLKDTTTDDNRRFEFVKEKITNKDIIDFGSGVGGFLIKAKNIAKSVVGVELDTKVIDFYKKNDIKIVQSIDDLKNNEFDIITAFHVLEHLKNPIDIIDKLIEKLKVGGNLIIEVPNSNDALLTVYKNQGFENFTYWSPHLYLYNDKTLRMLLNSCSGIKVDFIKYIQRYPLSNHLYWLSHNKPGGHKVWGGFIDSQELNRAYELQLASMGATDTLIAQITKI